MKLTKWMSGAMALAVCASLSLPAAAAPVQPESIRIMDTVAAQSVLPDSFQIRFVMPNGDLISETVVRNDYRGVEFPRVILDGELCNWKADCQDLLVKPGDYVSFQTLDLDFTWTEKNPTITFKAKSNAPVVLPDSYRVVFKDGERVILDHTFWGYEGIYAPRIVMGGELAQWKADCIDLRLEPGEYLNFDTFDWDYEWTQKNPTIVFTLPQEEKAPFVQEKPEAYKAPVVLPDSFHLRFVMPNGDLISETVVRDDYRGVKFPRVIVDGELCNWKADCIDMLVEPGDYVNFSDFDWFDWTEENPVITMKATSCLPTVEPKGFHVVFQSGDRVYMEKDLVGLWGMNAPRVVGLNGDMVRWKADCVELTLQERDYLSAQTLDLDFEWTSEYPTVVFSAVE